MPKHSLEHMRQQTAPHTPGSEPPKQTWLSGLEGPRGIACLSVLLVHVSAHYAPNIVDTIRIDFLGQGLTFFFVLSGFLLYLPYVRKLFAGSTQPSTRRYFIARVRRIFPAYLFIFLVTNFILQASYVVNPVSVGWTTSDAGTGMITNPFHLLAQLTLTQSFFPSTLQTGLNPSWSLTVELTFYLLLPLMAMGTFWLSRKTSISTLRLALIAPAVLIVVGAVTTSVVIALQNANPQLTPLERFWGPNWIAVLSRSFLALADNFAMGMIAAVVYVAIGGGALKAWSTIRIQFALGITVLVFLATALCCFVVAPRVMATPFAIASAALVLLIITPLARGEHSSIAAVTDWRPIKYVGTISLSIYLWHYPVMLLAERADIPVPATYFGVLWSFAALCGATIAIASLTYVVIERPAMRLWA